MFRLREVKKPADLDIRANHIEHTHMTMPTKSLRVDASGQPLLILRICSGMSRASSKEIRVKREFASQLT